MYYSNTKHKAMEVADMHMMHIENVLLKDLREGTLDWETTNELTDGYIAKSKEDRERLHKMLNASAQLNRFLMDLLTTGDPIVRKRKPAAKPVPPLHLHAPILDFYRQVALGFIRKYGRVSADQLRVTLERSGYTVHGPSLAHVFRDPRFRQVSYQRSGWEGAKGRFINVWTAA